MRKPMIAALVAATMVALPLAAQEAAQTPQVPGSLDPSRVTGGTYQVDPAHTLVGFRVNHLGFNDYFGIFGNATGTLTLDPAAPGEAEVVIEIPLTEATTASEGLTDHLQTPDFFDTANHPTARFVSTDVAVDGTRATITGDLTLRGVTRPVTIDAEFTGAGANPMTGAETIGFEGTTTVDRSEFGIDYGIPMVPDEVELQITAAFEKAEG